MFRASPNVLGWANLNWIFKAGSQINIVGMGKIRIAIVDDHSVVREGLRIILKSDSRFSVDGCFFTGDALLDFLTENQVDLVILDLDIPGGGDFAILKEIKQTYPDCKVIVYTMHSGISFFLGAKNLGANSYVVKTEPVTFMPTVIMYAMKGEFYASTELEVFMETSKPKILLTPVELEIVTCISKGMLYKEIAAKISRSEKTIEYYAKKIRKKLNVESNSELLVKVNR